MTGPFHDLRHAPARALETGNLGVEENAHVRIAFPTFLQDPAHEGIQDRAVVRGISGMIKTSQLKRRFPTTLPQEDRQQAVRARVR